MPRPNIKEMMSNGDTADQVLSHTWLVEKGYNHWVAEALSGREKTYNWLRFASPNEIMDEVLTWHGIQGFTSTIMTAIDNIRNQEAVCVFHRFVEATDEEGQLIEPAHDICIHCGELR